MDRKGSLFIWNREDLKHLVKVDCFIKMYLSEVMGLEEEKKKKPHLESGVFISIYVK